MGRSLNKKRKTVVLARDGYRCQYCGITVADGATLEVDHKVPLSRGGSDRVSNLIAACRDCNRSKRDKPLEIPCVNKPDRVIVNADGSLTNVLPIGVRSEDIAMQEAGKPQPCLRCEKPAMHRVVWSSDALIGRPNKRRSIVYPICDECADALFNRRKDSVGHEIEEKLLAIAARATHVRLIESFSLVEEQK
jgi:uncharacterized protein with PIN domain